mmetsp:Transcript_27812/g.42083  ORF Transcript_27812/g.42083 Transcript_27812/m.42083 type:complete len:157 (+) Transcript_27812:159-629(+)|eukprot:CAMPEP_0178911684 /NCGR_PEP_ID=MMETSP0786-20121207/9838_1 /TAXON_ID=186022 /ORGANISM="Thalassionema frauenfeldii, Strain CCMP 1798" /LENGTH=156 /DNA_ID=CAMNT_0020584171 /DNA_START=159 /DNA_END=629 /DNA_ORIENTATION=+
MKFASIFTLFLSVASVEGTKLKGKNAEGRDLMGKTQKKKGNTSKLADQFTGHYFGIDLDDGTVQQMTILCGFEGAADECSIVLRDSSFSTCGNGKNGLAIATGNLPLDDLELGLYCAAKGEDLDYTGEPTAYLVANFDSLTDKIIQRPNGYTYTKA